MNRPTDHERLMADVLADANPTGLREALFAETLRLARRRRQVRQARRAVPLLAVLFLLVLFVWRSPPRHSARQETARQSYTIVHSQPLSASALVATQPLPSVHSIAAHVQIVQTFPGDSQAREIGDDELLAMAEPKPAALVWLGPHAAELVVLSSADQDAPPPN